MNHEQYFLVENKYQKYQNNNQFYNVKRKIFKLNFLYKMWSSYVINSFEKI